MLTQCQVLFFTLLLTSCAGIPEGIKPITGFDANRYLGRWYEIARLDNRFERGLDQIRAEYGLAEDGGLSVNNSGRNVSTGERESAQGKAYFIRSPDIGSLKVSFFWPFYGGYHIIDLDKDRYSYVMIAGSSRDYLWILAREPTLDKSVLQRLISKAKTLQFDTDKLIYPEQ